MASTKRFEIAIIGGGIAGTTLAIALLKRNIRCQIYEKGRAFGEIGAGVAFTPNALRAMDACDPSMRAAFNSVTTPNWSQEKQESSFDVFDGAALDAEDGTQHLFTLLNGVGQNGCHRGALIDEYARLIPKDICHFDKHLDDIVENKATGILTLMFRDGSRVHVDAVVGCDGIKSRTREILVGKDHPSATSRYTHIYGYRGVVPMEKAVKLLGGDRALNSCIFMGPGCHMVTYPVSGGKVFNLFAAVHDPNDWPKDAGFTLPAKREEALKDFEHFGPAVRKTLGMVDADLDRWALFDTGDNPLPLYNRGRIVVSGDAAHATTPHHGAGAGMCVEDTAVLASLLADESVTQPEHLQAVFAAFDASRRERTQWVVRSSRRMSEVVQGRAADVGRDFEKIERETKERSAWIWDFDIEKAVRQARDDLRVRLGAPVGEQDRRVK